jgi:hypothetical protein
MEEKIKEIRELAETLMQSENLNASIELLHQFAAENYQQGAIDAQKDAMEHFKNHFSPRF